MGRWRYGALLVAMLLCAATPRAVVASPADKVILKAIHNLRSKSPEIRGSAARALAVFGRRAKRAAKPLVHALGDEDFDVREAVTSAIEAIGAASVPELVRGLASRDIGVRVGAARLWGAILLFPGPRADPTFAKGVKRCISHRPEWRWADLYYWHFATLVLAREKGAAAEGWREKVQAILLRRQRPKDDDPAFRGSWDPASVWGRDGGRIYSTAMAVLTLLVPYRYPEGFPAGPAPRPALDALRRACKDKVPAVRAAAAEALRRIAFR